MGLFDSIFNLAREPDAVVPLDKNINNYIYLEAGAGSYKDYNLFEHINSFIAREFTKVMITVKGDVSSKQSLDYLLNVRPNSDQTANEMLYVFAKSLLDHGLVYYKVTQPTNKTIKAFEVSPVKKPGYKLFKAKYLKTDIPQRLLDQYANLLYNLSNKQSANVLELNTKLKADTAPSDVSTKLAERLNSLRNQVDKYGAFTTVQDESSKDHQGLTNPDGTALNDLRTLIYEELNINSKILTGDYDESDYRAFYASHLVPISNALEELLDYAVIGRDNYINGARVDVILDLMQFSTLESFTQMAKEGIYNSYLTADEVREALGKDKYPDGLGELIMSNKNAVALNNDEINKKLETKGTNNAEE